MPQLDETGVYKKQRHHLWWRTNIMMARDGVHGIKATICRTRLLSRTIVHERETSRPSSNICEYCAQYARCYWDDQLESKWIYMYVFNMCETCATLTVKPLKINEPNSYTKHALDTTITRQSFNAKYESLCKELSLIENQAQNPINCIASIVVYGQITSQSRLSWTCNMQNNSQNIPWLKNSSQQPKTDGTEEAFSFGRRGRTHRRKSLERKSLWTQKTLLSLAIVDVMRDQDRTGMIAGKPSWWSCSLRIGCKGYCHDTIRHDEFGECMVVINNDIRQGSETNA